MLNDYFAKIGADLGSCSQTAQQIRIHIKYCKHTHTQTHTHTHVRMHAHTLIKTNTRNLNEHNTLTNKKCEQANTSCVSETACVSEAANTVYLNASCLSRSMILLLQFILFCFSHRVWALCLALVLCFSIRPTCHLYCDNQLIEEERVGCFV